MVGEACGRNKKEAKAFSYNVMSVKLAVFNKLLPDSAIKVIEEYYDQSDFSPPGVTKIQPLVTPTSATTTVVSKPAVPTGASTSSPPEVISFPNNLLAQVDKSGLVGKHPTSWIMEYCGKMKWPNPKYEEIPRPAPVARYKHYHKAIGVQSCCFHLRP